jgi:U-box domain
MAVSSTSPKVPQSYICPLTHEVMSRPMHHRLTGLNFEHSAIMEWLGLGNTTCPITDNDITVESFEENITLEREIRRWHKKRAQEKRETTSSHHQHGKFPLSPIVRDQICKTRAAHVLNMRNKVLQQREERLRALQACNIALQEIANFY